jgi:hypothetical protein
MIITNAVNVIHATNVNAVNANVSILNANVNVTRVNALKLFALKIHVMIEIHAIMLMGHKDHKVLLDSKEFKD